ncbi:MAG: ribosome silencing factor [Propionibacteriaceae bacterium]|nr:ribosome silencing factor [Propionibacteriaceae bacterium]
MAASNKAIDIARTVVHAAEEKLGQDILVLDVSEKLGIADIFVVISGANERQVGAIVDEIEEYAFIAGHDKPRREGSRDDPWVLLDFFETIVHVQLPEARVRYALDRLWKDCPVIELGGNQP